MPNYCKNCCKELGIKYDFTGKTCWAGMTCDKCGVKLNEYEKEGERRKKEE